MCCYNTTEGGFCSDNSKGSTLCPAPHTAFYCDSTDDCAPGLGCCLGSGGAQCRDPNVSSCQGGVWLCSADTLACPNNLTCSNTTPYRTCVP